MKTEGDWESELDNSLYCLSALMKIKPAPIYEVAVFEQFAKERF